MAAKDSVEHTPSWALATVCFFIVSVSVLLEHSIHLLTSWLKKHRKTALIDAVGRLKSELMLLGFMSLLLAMTQERISKICVSTKVAEIMLPCRKAETTASLENMEIHEHLNVGYLENVRLLDNISKNRDIYRRLSDDDGGDNENVGKIPQRTNATDSCTKGKVSLVSQEGVQQLQIFIFVLAAMQIVYSVLTMALGRAKMKRWKAWEKETQSIDYQIANDQNRFRFTRQTTFGRRHTAWTQTSAQLWIKCFFRQFFNSVAKVDYFTLRHGFITAHLSSRYNNFNFQKYIERSLDEDFKVVVSISPLMWFLVVIFFLVDVHGWHLYLWISFIPLLIVLLLGAKLEVIVAKMALRLKNQNSVTVGAPLVEPNDDLFWFGQPRFVLHLVHLTLFVNAFELAFFIWVTIQFGYDSCYHEYDAIIVTRIVLAVTVQVLCSYITLPLYALVTQMGSQFKSKTLEEKIATILKTWHAEVRDKRKKREQVVMESPRTCLSITRELTTDNPAEFSSFQLPSSSVPTEMHRLSMDEIVEEETIKH
ncbi:MLO-like protein 3 isoform X2 [Olea europaea var. sylvestris]|uniref:MLO-like protein 3 isoform X2 n=1 Tax=Olea europaea var. sylvestris TaxID=158386 RepID=UPI000C1D057B|nr:MLO-like protein 3 isoform X2 [Olea europaea var. sylvestris]